MPRKQKPRKKPARNGTVNVQLMRWKTMQAPDTPLRKLALRALENAEKHAADGDAPATLESAIRFAGLFCKLQGRWMKDKLPANGLLSAYGGDETKRDVIWEYWRAQHALGKSVAEIQKLSTQNGFRNEKTGKPFDRTTITRAIKASK